jgi:hypothetical protein
MKFATRLAALLLASIATALAPLAASAADESHVYVKNLTKAWVWITVYSRPYTGGGQYHGAEGAWCVPPGKYDQHGLKVRIHEVRAEISENPNCRVVIKDTGYEFGLRTVEEFTVEHSALHGYSFYRSK